MELFRVFIELIFALTLSFAVLVGLGRLVRNCYGGDHFAPIDSTDAWLGLTLSILFVEGINYFLPIDWRVSLLVIIFGLSALVFYKGSLAKTNEKIKDYLTSYPKFSAFLMLLLLLWCTQALNVPSHPDSGSYHFPSIRWINESALVPGLAHLNSRLAFNQSWFSVVALLNFSPYWEKGHALAGMLLILLVVTTVIEAGFHKYRAGGWLIALLLIGIDKSFRTWLSSPAPDMAVVAFQTAIFVMLLKFLLEFPKENQIVDLPLAIVLLCIASITVKLSTAMFSFMSASIVMVLFNGSIMRHWKSCAKVMLIGAIIFGVHIGRGFYLSGLPLYPSTLGAIWNLEWSVTPKMAANEIHNIVVWARRSWNEIDQGIGNWNWVAGWFKHVWQEESEYIVLSIIFPIIAIITTVRNKKSYRIITIKNNILLAFLPLIVSGIFWFFTAPDWRFIGAIPWMMISLGAWLCISHISIKYIKLIVGWHSSPFGLVIIIGACALLFNSFLRTAHWSELGKIPSQTFMREKTISGLEINVIKDGECWATKPPCVGGGYNQNLRLLQIHDNYSDQKYGFTSRPIDN